MSTDFDTQMQKALERVEHFKKFLPLFAVQYKQARRQAKKLRRTEEMRERAEMRAHPLKYRGTVDGWAGRTWEWGAGGGDDLRGGVRVSCFRGEVVWLAGKGGQSKGRGGQGGQENFF